MCGRLCCPFRSSNSDSKTDLEDDLTRILIFGVTGMIGSAVMEATLSCAWFKITGFTRARDGEILDELVSKGIDVISGDMKDPNSLLVAMQEIDVIFLTTHYWETMSSENEYIQVGGASFVLNAGWLISRCCCCSSYFDRVVA
ncbi:isoflavone reductase-like protein [Aplysia californica]|uniref:Isoflavone reductase-like protein n=1 Tax=Aplysia californica TaxID=6500 RepID=A0ABM1A743_APLCA|nr:isoflavone reductase-like protein [Aplysia californica]